jgi:hypothetical protein
MRGLRETRIGIRSGWRQRRKVIATHTKMATIIQFIAGHDGSIEFCRCPATSSADRQVTQSWALDKSQQHRIAGAVQALDSSSVWLASGRRKVEVRTFSTRRRSQPRAVGL